MEGILLNSCIIS